MNEKKSAAFQFSSTRCERRYFHEIESLRIINLEEYAQLSSV